MRAGLPADVAALVDAERLGDAAGVAELHGDFALARELYAEACDFARAARAAERMDDLPTALVHFAEAGALADVERLLPRLGRAPQALELAAFRLQSRGFDRAEGLVRERMNDFEAAANAFERAGDALRAATVLERAGQWAIAGRMLETALRRDPSRNDVALWLGELLLRCGKAEAAVRVLQRVPAEARERRAALAALSAAYDRMGLYQAQAETHAELQQLGPQSLRASVVPAPLPSSAALVAQAELLFGRYAPLSIVHESATARVLHCNDTLRADEVALKLFVGRDLLGTGRDALVRFEREIVALRALEHPHVVRPRDYLADGPAVVTEWMAQGSLAALLEREAVTPQRAVEIAIAVLGALGQAHTLGILHRDVKPANVLFDAAGTPKLADFGVAHLGDLSSTVTAGLIGTFAYMSPEQRRGQGAVVQSDLYGVGAMLLEMLTGTPPTDDAAPKPSAFHRELSAAHDAVVMQLLAAQPDARPDSANDAIRALTMLRWPTLLDHVVVRQPPPERPSGRLDDDRGRYRRDKRGFVCTRSGRSVERVALDTTHLARARMFAQCINRSVQALLTASTSEGALWLELPAGRTLARALTRAECRLLREGLEVLHGHGYVHGQIDSEHLWETDRGVLLRYAAELPALGSAALDLRALDQLTARLV